MKFITKIQPQVKFEMINWYGKYLNYIKANFGCFNIPLSSRLVIKNNQLFMNQDKKNFKTQLRPFCFKNYGVTNFTHLIQNTIIAIYSKYEKKLRMGGRNFNFTITDNLLMLIIKVGLTDDLKKQISPFFKCKISRKYRVLRIKSIFVEKLNTLAANIRVGFKRNVYTGKGVRYKGEIRITKVMHKTRR